VHARAIDGEAFDKATRALLGRFAEEANHVTARIRILMEKSCSLCQSRVLRILCDGV
jgi:hypothetical protein